jgi:endoglucanase
MQVASMLLSVASCLILDLLLPGGETAGPPALKVVGRHLTTPGGKVVRLRGVNIPSLEWGQGEHLSQSLDAAVGDWGATIVRLPLSQDRWFGHTREKKDGGAQYRRTVHDLVARAADRRCYVILDLHWSNAGTWGENIGQHKMPDDNSVAFWNEVASSFGNHPAVLFGLYNEPYGVSWKIWRDGGQAVEANKKAPNGKLEYHTPGMQKLLDVCRARGARTVVVVGGLDWAYDLTGIGRGYALDDPSGSGIVYDTHLYPMKKWFTRGNSKTQDWDRFILSAASNHAVLIGEFGNGKDDYEKKVLEFAENNDLPWIAWCLHPGARPNLIKDWKYTPTAYGEVVKAALQGSP